VTSYTYDAQARLISTKTPAGLTTTNIYFASGDYTNFVQTTIDLEIGRTNSFTYTNNLVATRTDERGVTTTYTYDNLQRLTSVSDPRGAVTYTYDKLDLVRVVDRLNFTNTFVYDNVRNKIAETNALGRATIYNYCNCGSLDSIRDAAGNYTHFYYNIAGWLTNTTYADGYSVSREYDRLGRLTAIYDGTGHGTTNWYNNQGLLYAVSNSFGLVSLSVFDDEDRATNHTDANSVTISSTFDNLGRTLTRSYPDGGVEKFGYSARGLVTYTNQLNFGTLYTYDEARRKVGETNANNEITQFHYDSSGNLIQLTDAKNQNTLWNYDQYSRVTNKVDNLGTNIFKYAYDGDNRLTNRWTPAKGTTSYSYDNVGNLASIQYPVSSNINLAYDALNRLTNMVDGIGTTKYSYDGAGALLSEDGPFADDAVSYSYANRLRAGLILLQPNSDAWSQSYGYDDARRLSSITSPAGTFSYLYPDGIQNLVSSIGLSGGAYVTNTYDSSARMRGTWLENSTNGILNSHVYGYDRANQRTQQVFTAANYTDYTYDPIGQLKTALGKESGGLTNRAHEQFGYAYDAGGNLNWRTNNDLLQNFAVNSLNELTASGRNTNMTVAGTTTSLATNVTVNGLSAAIYSDATFARTNVGLVDGNNTLTAVAHDTYGRSDTSTSICYLPATTSFVYDLNGNLRTNGTRIFDYDDENELIRITEPNQWKSEFSYDGKLRRRIRKEFTWLSAIGDWRLTNEVHYAYDGNLVVQERWYNLQLSTTNLQQFVTYTSVLACMYWRKDGTTPSARNSLSSKCVIGISAGMISMAR
jgi:YD repeat-containing protein